MTKEIEFLETISTLVWNDISKQELVEILKDRKEALKEQLTIPDVVGRSEQLCQHQWHKHPSHPKIGAMLCRKCGTELA